MYLIAMSISKFGKIYTFQIMEGTDNIKSVAKLMDIEDPDPEIYECVIRIVVNLVQSCFEPSIHNRDALDTKVLDCLCRARVPAIIVSELKNRRVTSIGKSVVDFCLF